jgi:purine-cytosine permease-like protein
VIDDQEKIYLIILLLLLVAAGFATLSAALFGQASGAPITETETKGMGCWWIVIAFVVIMVIVTMLPAANTIYLLP